MSAAQTAKTVGAAMTKAAEMASHFHTLTSLFGAFKGIPPVGEVPTIVKGISGIFGYKDERALEVLINKLEHDTTEIEGVVNYFKDSREVLTGFFLWHFKATTIDEQVLTWWYGNAFRTFLTNMDDAGHMKGNSTTTIEDPVDEKTKKKTKTVITEEIIAHSHHALDFLKMMVKTNKSTGDKNSVEKNRIKGYKKLLKQFKALGVPHIPGNAHGRASELKVQLESVATKCEAAATQSAAKPKSWLNRILRSI